MKSHSLINLRMVTYAVCAFALASGVLVSRAHADQWDKKTILTVNQPVQVEERLLQPGQYVLKLDDSNSNRHIVRIYNGDQSHLIDTVLAIPNYRLQPTGNSQFLFWETPPGNAKALRAWFYPGDNFGQEFTYPKHLERLEASVSTTVATPTPQIAVAPPQPETPTTEPTQPMTEEPKREEQPVETAQAAPPPPQPTTAAPAPAPPQTLPKTATQYPLIGICGAFALGLAGLLRLRRSA